MLTHVGGDLADGVRRENARQSRRSVGDAEQQAGVPRCYVDMVDDEAAVLKATAADGGCQQDHSHVGRGTRHVARGDKEYSRK